MKISSISTKNWILYITRFRWLSKSMGRFFSRVSIHRRRLGSYRAHPRSSGYTPVLSGYTPVLPGTALYVGECKAIDSPGETSPKQMRAGICHPTSLTPFFAPRQSAKFESCVVRSFFCLSDYVRVRFRDLALPFLPTCIWGY